MNEQKAADKCIQRLIRSAEGLSDGVTMIAEDLRRVYSFSDVRRFSAATVEACYHEFEAWLSRLLVREPMPSGILGLYFGLFDTAQGTVIYVSGSKQFDPRDPDWACRNNWLPEGGSIVPELYKDISMAFSQFSRVGYYLAVGVLTVMLVEYATNGPVSLLDAERQSLNLACGFDDGVLYNVGEITEDGLLLPENMRVWKPFG